MEMVPKAAAVPVLRPHAPGKDSRGGEPDYLIGHGIDSRQRIPSLVAASAN